VFSLKGLLADVSKKGGILGGPGRLFPYHPGKCLVRNWPGHMTFGGGEGMGGGGGGGELTMAMSGGENIEINLKARTFLGDQKHAFLREEQVLEG